MYSYSSRSDTLKKIVIGVIITAVIIGLVWFTAVSGGKMTKVIVHNTGFWIVMFVAFVFGIIRKLTKPKKFTWLELPIQLLVSFIVIVALYAIFFSTSANLTDREIWNGYVEQAEYYEEWTELETYTEQVQTGTDSKGNATYTTVTKTRNVYHGPEWRIVTTAGNFGTRKKIYKNYLNYFGGERKKNLLRANQISIGDGDMFYIQLPKNSLPASQEHSYVNYLKASNSVRKVSGFISTYKDFLLPYPRLYARQFGEIEIDRVLNVGVNLSKGWSDVVDKKLDLALTYLGAQKQANILVYLMNTADQQAVYALEEFWVKGKKNDIIIVIGSTNFPKINFVHIMAWTKIEEFKIELRNKLLNLGTLSDGNAVAQAIINQVAKAPENGGFERMPMADLEYLIAEIELPLWCQILIVLIGGFASWITSFFLIRNDIENY